MFSLGLVCLMVLACLWPEGEKGGEKGGEEHFSQSFTFAFFRELGGVGEALAFLEDSNVVRFSMDVSFRFWRANSCLGCNHFRQIEMGRDQLVG